ncbi:MAG: sensor histidine kinase [Proteobacteria bacterium]|nr:sensor histidine kinase [Pseudomonadota bacterium]
MQAGLVRAEERQQLRSAIGVTVGFFAFTLCVFALSSYFRSPNSFQEVKVVGLPMILVDGLIGFSLYFVLRWTEAMHAVLRWPLVAIAVVVIALLQAVWDTELRVWTGMMTMDYRQAFIRATTLNTYNTGMLAAILAFQAAYSALKRNQSLLDAAHQREREAQMLALRFQLNPHFLFNTLNAISSLVVLGRDRDAEAMIDRLSSFLRASLAADPDRMVAIEEEFEMLDNYLDIEGVRFGERLVTSVTLPPELARAQVPPFLLQPLVENAVKYAVAPSRAPVRIDISARERDGRLELSVADSGSNGMHVMSGTGVGLANVRERLRLSFGDKGEMAVTEAENGFRVVLTMPLKLMPEPVLTKAA